MYCKGPDYRNKSKDIGEINNEIKALNKIGGKIVFTGGRTFSSSNLINRYSDNITENQKKSIISIKKKI